MSLILMSMFTLPTWPTLSLCRFSHYDGLLWTRPYRFHIALRCKTNNHTLHFICHLDNKGRALSTKNCSEENCRKDVTGNSRCVVYVLNDPHRLCYSQFFVRNQPPNGLRTGNANLQNIRYICQPLSICGQPNDNFYATMFDEEQGIAVFSAYALTQAMVDFNNYPQRRRHEWYPTPGNSLIYPQNGANPPWFPHAQHCVNVCFIALVAINGNVLIRDRFKSSPWLFFKCLIFYSGAPAARRSAKGSPIPI